jgi:hypothetical protein
MVHFSFRVVLPETRDKCRDLLVDLAGQRLGDGAELLEGYVHRRVTLSGHPGGTGRLHSQTVNGSWYALADLQD